MQDLVMTALVGEVDPPRAEAKDSIAEAKNAGHPGQDDHRGPCGDRGGHRAGAGD